MNKMSLSPFVPLANTVLRIFTGFLAVAGMITLVHAQGELASGTLTGSGSGLYIYSLTFSDAAGAASPVGSIWYAWIPGEFYLPGTPTSASAPAGWTASIVNNSIQYVADSAADDITAGQSLAGFGYQATFSPAQLAAATDSGVSVAYSAGLFSDDGDTFTVQAVPEPSGRILLCLGATVCWLGTRRIICPA